MKSGAAKKLLQFSAVFSIAVTFGCRVSIPKPGHTDNSDSDVEALNRAEKIASSIGAGKPGEVLIYYSAESAPQDEELQNLQALEGRLTKYPELKQMVDSLQLDRKAFPAAVDKQIDDLQKKLCGQPDKALIIFSNRSLRGPNAAKSITFCAPGVAPSTRDLSPSFQDLVKAHPTLQATMFAKANPTTMPAVFDWALTQTRGIFPPDKFSYVLVTKSHGSGEYLLTPKVTMLNSEVQEADINSLRGAQLWKTFMYFSDFFLNKPAFGSNADRPMSRFQRLSQLDKAGQDKVGEDKVGEDKVGDQDKAGQDKAGQDKDGQDKAGQDKAGQDGLDDKTGVPKWTYTNIVTGHKDMLFSLIFLDACKSYLPNNIVDSLRKDASKSNIGDIYTSDQDGLPYDLLDYSAVNFAPRVRLYDTMYHALADKVGK